MKFFLTLLSLLLLSLLHSQTSNVSSNNNVVGLEHNTLFNATKRYSVTQSGPHMNLEKLFDGKFEPDYSSGTVSTSNPKIITVENLNGVHTQLGAWVGWSTRYYAAKRFKIEGYDASNGNQWRVIADYSGINYDSNLFMTKIPVSGVYTKLRFTFYEADPNGLGISELFFLHPEATTPYEGLLNPTTTYSSTQGEWKKSGQNIYYNLGNVGIGTENPQAKLDVGVDVIFGDFISSGSNSWMFHSPDDGRTSLHIAPKGASGNFDWNKQLVLNEGNMALYGKFEAKEIKVTLTPTADFVFEEKYHLPKLEEVEKYVKEKKHLPEIASAKEMEKEGVNVGEFQIKLLQKIEELTLYLIEQKKEIQNLKSENKEIKKRLKTN